MVKIIDCISTALGIKQPLVNVCYSRKEYQNVTGRNQPLANYAILCAEYRTRLCFWWCGVLNVVRVSLMRDQGIGVWQKNWLL